MRSKVKFLIILMFAFLSFSAFATSSSLESVQLAEGIEALAAKDYDKTLKIAQTLVREYPPNVQHYELLANALIAKHRFREVEMLVSRLESENRASPHLYLRKAQAVFFLGEYVKSLSVLRKMEREFEK